MNNCSNIKTIAKPTKASFIWRVLVSGGRLEFDGGKV
jgi:hypothetical protein